MHIFYSYLVYMLHVRIVIREGIFGEEGKKGNKQMLSAKKSFISFLKQLSDRETFITFSANN